MKKNKKDYELIKQLKDISDAKYELQVANENFETAENELIDYYAYEIKAIKAKLDYLIRSVKKNKLAVSLNNQISKEEVINE